MVLLQLAEQVLLDNGDSLWENILQSLSLNRHELERAISGTERNVHSTLYRLNGVSSQSPNGAASHLEACLYQLQLRMKVVFNCNVLLGRL